MKVGRDEHGLVHAGFWIDNTLYNKARCNYAIEIIQRDEDVQEHLTCLACVVGEVTKRTT